MYISAIEYTTMTSLHSPTLSHIIKIDQQYLNVHIAGYLTGGPGWVDPRTPKQLRRRLQIKVRLRYLKCVAVQSIFVVVLGPTVRVRINGRSQH